MLSHIIPKSYFCWRIIFIGFAIICAPFRTIFEYFYLQNPDMFRKPNNPTNHKKKVKKIQTQIIKWDSGGRNGLLCSARASWKQFAMRDLDKTKMNQIEMDLDDIVHIDAVNMVLTVEPGMRMGTIIWKLLPMGFTIPVVPEVEELTIGGLVCGFGVESSSHKYGLFFQTCIEYEVVLPNGSCVNCSKIENSDLFESVPMSNGTVGLITAVKIPLLQAKRYVELSYYPATTYESAVKLLSDSTHDFVEGLYLGLNKFVIVYGNMTDDMSRSHKPKTFTKWYDQIFHWDAEKYFDKPFPSQNQFVPLREYYLRHRRGYFWAWTTVAPYFKYAVVRYTIGWALPISGILAKMFFTLLLGKRRFSNIMEVFGSKIRVFLQDYTVPMEKMPEFLEMISNDLEIYPVWIGPTRVFPSKGMIQPRNNQETLYADIGVWGRSPKEISNILKVWKSYENFTIENNGYVWFYTDHYLSREDFNKMFPSKLYSEVRKKYGCEGAFLHVYDKVTRIPEMQQKSK